MENILPELLCLVLYIANKWFFPPYKYYTTKVYVPIKTTQDVYLGHELALHTLKNNLRYHKRSDSWQIQQSRFVLLFSTWKGLRLEEIKYWEPLYEQEIDRVKKRLAKKRKLRVALY